MRQRTTLLHEFLRSCGADTAVVWLPADASTRRYGRVQYQGTSSIIMDAPPNAATRTTEFIAIAQLLRAHGLSAPEILAADAAQGFLLLEDLGAELFSHRTTSQELYSLAYDNIEALQSRVTQDPNIAPAYDSAVMAKELLLFRDWYCPAAGIELPESAWHEFEALARKHQTKIAALPQRFVLRDCHVDNFLYRPDETGLAQCGILDFQDGGWGSALYDVTSLVFDARRDVPDEIQANILQRHAKFLGISWSDYAPAAAYLVLQRALKVLGIFTRLNARDGKSAYLVHLARCWQQIMQSCQYLPDWQGWFVLHTPMKKPDLHPILPVDTAMLLAAGQGTRMGALGQATPKPLLDVAGTSIIKRGQDNMRKAGMGRFIINAHHHADQVRAHFQNSGDTQVLTEPERLETGGGVRNAVPIIGRELFWVMNGDSLWQGSMAHSAIHDAVSAITQNSAAETYHDCGFGLLLLIDEKNWRGQDFTADFAFCDHRILRRATDHVGYGYSGVMLLHRAAIFHEPIEHFSLNRVFDDLIARKRLFGVTVDWSFYHVGTPAALTQANQAFREA